MSPTVFPPHSWDLADERHLPKSRRHLSADSGNLSEKWLVSNSCTPHWSLLPAESGNRTATGNVPDSKVYGANMGPICGRQDPGGRHVGPMDFAIWGIYWILKCREISRHDDILAWKRCPHNWPFMRDSIAYRWIPLTRGLYCGTLMFPLLLVIWDAVALLWRHGHGILSAILYSVFCLPIT